MRFIPAEPDIATVFSRIIDNDIDLQPDFQRGEVWSIAKKQRLIDTILRGWVIPPVLLVSNGSGQEQQVLDGQQRLASIRDFMLNEFPVEGNVEPIDDKIINLHGIKYNGLPAEIKRAFLRTPIRMYEISDYRPEEPAEIFFRLNQPTGLTPAEKRNAFFGPVRDQIRKIVEHFQNEGNIYQDFLGFSNSRMAYDDVFARFTCTLELGSLASKVTAAAVDQLYRQKTPLRNVVLQRLQHCINTILSVFSEVEKMSIKKEIKLNKATFYSWLIFFSRMPNSNIKELSKFFVEFESLRSASSFQVRSHSSIPEFLMPFLLIYNDMASARVADVSSVLLRDMCLWSVWAYLKKYNSPEWQNSTYFGLKSFLESTEQYINDDAFESSMLEFIESSGWGQVI